MEIVPLRRQNDDVGIGEDPHAETLRLTKELA